MDLVFCYAPSQVAFGTRSFDSSDTHGDIINVTLCIGVGIDLNSYPYAVLIC